MRNLIFFGLMLMLAGCSSSGSQATLTMDSDELYPEPMMRELAEAAGRGRFKRVDALIDQGVDINSKGERGVNVLFWPLRQQNKQGFQKLLNEGADPDVQWDDGTSITELVAGIEDPDYLKMVLKAGANPNQTNHKSNKTPIFQAVLMSRIENIQLLLGAGADINDATNSAHQTPIFIAIAVGDFKTALFLAKAGADLTHKNVWGNRIKYLIDPQLDKPLPGEKNYPYYAELLVMYEEALKKQGQQ